MMISEEQARAAALLLSTGGASDHSRTHRDVSPELMAEALAVVARTPDTSQQRLSHARSYLEGDSADSRKVASMMIQRIISDSLR